MDRFEMMKKISARLDCGMSLMVRVTEARGYTYTHTYKVDSTGDITRVGGAWRKTGTLRAIYHNIVLGKMQPVDQFPTISIEQ